MLAYKTFDYLTGVIFGNAADECCPKEDGDKNRGCYGSSYTEPDAYDFHSLEICPEYIRKQIN